jgi:hypothetical protein
MAARLFPCADTFLDLAFLLVSNIKLYARERTHTSIPVFLEGIFLKSRDGHRVLEQSEDRLRLKH